MIPCFSCGKQNSAESNFCRFCGARFRDAQAAPDFGYDYSAPRPYSWKTDEFQTQSEPRRVVSQPQPLTHQPVQGQSLAYQGPQNVAGYHCPRCGTTYLPVVERRVSTAGWITFSVLLVFTVVFFWIGLLMKEDVSVCPVCRTKLS